MEKVTGIGGLFFRAHDPKALGRWHQQHLGVSLTPSSYEESVWEQEAGPPSSVLPLRRATISGDAHQVWMVNFRVRDLDRIAATTSGRNRDQHGSAVLSQRPVRSPT
jgi:glyoxylase I family protein